MGAAALAAFKVAKLVPPLVWVLLAVVVWALLATHHSHVSDRALKDEKGAEVQREATALELNQKEAARQADVLKEKLNDQGKDLAAARAAAARGDTAAARLRAALKANADHLHQPGPVDVTAISAAGDNAARVAGLCVDEYRHLGNVASDAVSRGLECERRSDAALPEVASPAK